MKKHLSFHSHSLSLTPFHSLIILSLIFTFLLSPFTPAQAQKGKAVEFTTEGLPDRLLEYMNKSTSASDKQKENTKIIKAFKPVYEGMATPMQERLTDFYAYAAKLKMKGNPELSSLTQMLTTFATADGGTNLDGYVESLEALKKKGVKSKGIIEYVDFCAQLQEERLLYRSSSCEWCFEKGTAFRLGVKKEVPSVWFDSPADLHYSSAKDHGVIHGTTGEYDYKDNLWRGNGGRLDWSRTGLKADECYADLGRYKAETKLPKFKADSVMFVHTAYFSSPIVGRVEEALSNVMAPEKYSYPRFRSRQRDFVMKDIMPGVDYSGSFMINGAKFITASSKHPATLLFNRDGHKQLAVSSLKITLTPTQLTAENASVSLYVGEDDSISNTGITVRYAPAEKQVALVNDSKRNFYSPYNDSYHNLDIYSESIVWKVESGEVLFSNLGTEGGYSACTFESSNYYTYNKYREINGIDQVSPVDRVYNFTRSNGSEFSLDDFSNFIGLDRSQTMLMIHNLSRHGLVGYNDITGRVKMKDKLVDYQKAATKNKEYDFDAISLESATGGTNARMKFEDNMLIIRGVKSFVVSDSQAVVVYPDSLTGRKVIVGRDRALHFNGRIDVGKFILKVKDCDFSYENFSFNMPTIERLEFYVPDFQDPDKYEQLVRTPLSNLVGTLEVDRPDNHSGLKKNKEYPIFKSLENSYVYYDSKSIMEGQYKREKFYYTLHPFTINSLADFVTDSLQFNGVLTSGGIFPDIVEPLRVQKDYYLGFRTETPDGGLPAYGGKGHYTKKLKLDHSGLRGSGELTYLASRAKSKDFLFLPDSTVALTDTFNVREEQGFPDIAGGRTDLHWLPYQDSMAVATVEKGNALKMYRGETALRGRVALMPKGASAAGTAEVHEGTLVSQHFALAPREMNASVSNFTLRSRRFKTTAFTATNVRSSVNYDSQRAELQSNGGPSATELQMIKYRAYADLFTWDMQAQQLELSNSTRNSSEGLDAMDVRMRLLKGDDLPGARFVSTDPKCKELSFNAVKSIYDYDLGELKSTGTYVLHVADAAIVPGADTVHVSKGGEMRELHKAQLLFNRDSAYHYITAADLQVKGSDSFTGKGDYTFHNDQQKTQKIHFEDITVQNGITVARGNIADEASFTLSSAFGFAGKVRLEGNHRWPWFEGGVRLIQPCLPQEQLALLAYSGYTDPDHIHVTVPEDPTDWKGRRITASILMDKATLLPHAAFLTNEKVADNELLKAYGVLTYLGDRKEYMISSEAKVADPDGIVAPFLTLSTTDCRIEGEGPMNFARRKTQASLYAYGTSTLGIRDDKDDQLVTVFGVDFPLDNSVVSALAANLKNELRLTPVGMTTNAEMRHALMHHLGADKGGAVYAMYSTSGVLTEIPAPMRSMLLFDNIRWQHNPLLGLWCEGKVGLVGVGGTPLGVTVNVKAQLYMEKGNQKLKLYVEAAKDHWYFFYYDFTSQDLTIYSSVGTWDDQIKALSLDQRKVSKEGLGTFFYHVGNVSNYVSKWLTSFNRSAHPDDID